MAKKKFKQPWDGVDVNPEEKYENSDKPSITVPGEAMTIKEIMARAMAGTEPDRRDAKYFDEEDLAQISEFFGPHIDLTDVDRLNARATELLGYIEEAKKRKDGANDKDSDSGSGLDNDFGNGDAGDSGDSGSDDA